jgi:hypothetical protein
LPGDDRLGAGASHVQTTSAEAAAFSRFRTFGFRLAEQPPSPYELSARSFEVERRVHDAVAAELVRKGYTETGADADLLIRISSGSASGDKTEPVTTSGGTENDPQRITLGESWSTHSIEGQDNRCGTGLHRRRSIPSASTRPRSKLPCSEC